MSMEIKYRLSKYREIIESGCWIWKGSKNKQGYGRIRVEKKLLVTHRVSAAAYLGFDIGSKMFVLHKCDEPMCFNPDHLFIGDQTDNMRDCAKKNRFNDRKGVKNGRAKLSEEQVIFIKNSNDSQNSLGKIFAVSQNTIHKIKSGKSWKHVTY